ncbi:GSCOCG00004720001-RA-CDS [Cotesia congregata]|nr:GSCOCG00004720001-RA-CDS [Cotesia congregata]
MFQSLARSVSSLRTSIETCCLIVINWEALNLATTDFKTSLQILGRTFSS